LPVGLAAGLLASAFPAVAGATDYCVDATPACGSKNVPGIQEALNLADGSSGADRIFLGPGTHTAPVASGFDYDNPSGPVEIIGTGRGGPDETVITRPPGTSGYVLSLIGGPGTSIHDVRIQLPDNVAPGFTALRTNGTVRETTLVELPQQGNGRYGVVLMGGVLQDSNIILSLTNTGGVVFENGGGTVRNSGVSADHGIISSYGGLVEQSGVLARTHAVIASRGHTTIRSSRINVDGTFGDGIAAFVTAGFNTTVVADGVSIVGPGGSGSTGVRVSTSLAPSSNASLTLTNSFLRRFGTTLDVLGLGSGTAHVSASYSDYDATKNLRNGLSASIAETNISNVGDVGFMDVSDGDYALLPGSPLVDAGDPSAPQGLDAVGNPLVTDGNLDGIARRDIGPFELPAPVPPGGGGQPPAGGGQLPAGGDQGAAADRQAPLVSGFLSTKKLFAVGRARTAVSASAHRTRFRYTLDEPARVTISIQRALSHGRYRTVGKLTRNAAQGANSTVFSGRIGRRALRPGRWRAVARATDAAGNRSAPARTRFRIAAR
jgi:hypothetical protein